MPSTDHESIRSHVEDTDVVVVAFEDMLDPDHKNRLRRIGKEDPVLRELILERANYLSKQLAKRVLTESAIGKLIIDEITYVVAIKDTSTDRMIRERREATTSDGVDGEDQPL